MAQAFSTCATVHNVALDAACHCYESSNTPVSSVTNDPMSTPDGLILMLSKTIDKGVDRDPLMLIG